MKKYLKLFIAVLILLNVGVGVSVKASESDTFLTEVISTPWNVNNDENKEVDVIEFIDEYVDEPKPGHEISMTKLLYILKDGTKISVAICESTYGNTIVYYAPESNILLLEKYKNDCLVQSLDLSKALSYENEEPVPTYVPEYNTEITEFGWGYSFNIDTRSFSCASSLVLDGTYSRRNIEIYPNEAKNEQEDFSVAVYKIQAAEHKLKTIPLDITYTGFMYLLGDVIGASYGNLSDMIDNISSIAEVISGGAEVLRLSTKIAEESECLYDLYAILHTYDHLD